MRSRTLILLTSVSMDGLADRPDATIDWQTPAPADEQLIALRKVVNAPPQLVFRLYIEAEHLGPLVGPHLELVIDELDLRVGGRYRFVHHAPDGQQLAFPGAYLEIDCPRRVVKSFVYQGKPRGRGHRHRHPSSRWTKERWSGCARVHSSITARDAHFESGAAPGLRASGRARDIATERSIPLSKLILKMSMSLDGFAADASGDNAFIFSSMSEDAVAWTMDTLGGTAAHLMGSNTYHDMAAHWPESDSVFAAPMNDLPKIVFSHSMTTAEWGETRIVAGDLAEGVAKLKAERIGGYLLAHGGARFARSLVSTGLIDEYRLLGHPAVPGDGKPIFPGRMDFEPVSTTAFSSGAVAHVCRGAGN
jgi:dihydrofolate reductase/uncharacterized protein YndB with AHSA1/START domain